MERPNAPARCLSRCYFPARLSWPLERWGCAPVETAGRPGPWLYTCHTLWKKTITDLELVRIFSAFPERSAQRLDIVLSPAVLTGALPPRPPAKRWPSFTGILLMRQVNNQGQ